VNFVRDDLKRLRAPFTLTATLIVLGVGALVVSSNYLDAARDAQNASRQGRSAAQDRVSKVSEEERDIRENLKYFEQMRTSGIVGVQNRLDWIEAIAKIKNTRKLFEVKYSIEAQKLLDYPGVVSSPNAEFVVSRMKLDMMLLHEGDLLDFLDDLQTEGRAYVNIKRCTVTRTAPGTATALQPRLRAECLVDLVSVKGIKPA
jgi:hypothetical protein